MTNTGILVTAYARPDLLRLVLESLKRQDALGNVHVWIDGTSGRRELTTEHKKCAELAKSYPVNEVRAHAGHLGIEKLMIDGLAFMMEHYDRIIILEDDCFPVRGAIREFEAALDEIDGDDRVFSVYGHHFMVPSEGPRFSRFQGWGWATTTRKLRPIHQEISQLFFLSEKEYLARVQKLVTPEVTSRLDKTSPRDVLHVLSLFFSWDSCTSLLTAVQELDHAPTKRRIIYNCGLTPGHGHFQPQEKNRRPPYNMIAPDEVWSVYDIE